MKSQLNFINFVVPKFLFEKLPIEKEDDSFEIKPQAVINREKGQFHINIDIEINDSENSFSLKMFAVGVFEFEVEKEEYLLNFMSINGPAIIFPYIRSFVSSFTSLSGFDTITLPTLNLSGFKDEILNNLIDVNHLKDE